jgi:N-carbamoylputrescine amidase
LGSFQSLKGKSMTLKVTVCEFQDDPNGLAQDWEQLAAHVKTESSNVVLLPEMPFYPWFARAKQFDPAVWQGAVNTHEVWQKRFNELAPAVIIGTRPINDSSYRLNEGFVWEQVPGCRTAHRKYYLPDEEGYWEASWYQRGDGSFTPINSGALRIGFLICTELWFMERARRYGKAGANLIVTPRATGRSTVEKWLTGGRTAAIVSGAFSLSSNRVNPENQAQEFGGQGWVIGPDGEILGLTSRQHPFVTVEIDLFESEQAKLTYPRYVLE